MIVFPSLLAGPAEEAGINLPEDLENYDVNNYLHWHVFSTLQLGRPMPSADAHWENAKVIAKIQGDKIRVVTERDVEKLGFR